MGWGASYSPCSVGLIGWAYYAGVVTDWGGAFDLAHWEVYFDLETFDDFESAFDSVLGDPDGAFGLEGVADGQG